MDKYGFVQQGNNHGPISDQHRQAIKNKGTMRANNQKKIKCQYCDAVMNIGNIARYHNEQCKQRDIINVTI